MAWHVSGTVYCDANHDGAISTGDTPLSGIVVRATSQIVSPGTFYTDDTSGSGAYFVPLPDDEDDYRVGPTGLPGGFSVILPPGGTHLVELSNAHVSESNKNFLVGGCAPVVTTTSSSSSTSTSSSTTTSSSLPVSTTVSTTSTSTSTSSSTTTTLLCGCNDTPFLSATGSRYNNDGQVLGTVGVNEPGRTLRFGRNVFMADDTSARADRVILGNGSDVSSVHANTVMKGQGAVVRDAEQQVSLPLEEDPFCSAGDFDCGGPSVIADGLDPVHLQPGSYSALIMGSGSIVVLDPGDYFFCDVKLVRNATLRADTGARINVTGSLRIGNGSLVSPLVGITPIPVNVLGRLVRVSQGATAHIAVRAPNAKLTLGRDGTIIGCFCVDTSKTDKHTFVSCSG